MVKDIKEGYFPQKNDVILLVKNLKTEDITQAEVDLFKKTNAVGKICMVQNVISSSQEQQYLVLDLIADKSVFVGLNDYKDNMDRLSTAFKARATVFVVNSELSENMSLNDNLSKKNVASLLNNLRNSGSTKNTSDNDKKLM